jgi:hypothetical protein
MTTTERPPSDDVESDTVGGDTGTDAKPRRAARGDRPTASERAYERRRRREQSLLDPRLTAVGRPIRASLGKVPVVLAAIVLLGGGIAGVLTINTMADEIGLQTTRTASVNEALQLTVQALQQAVADADSTPRIAQQARRLGMGPADDPAIITIDGRGHSTVIGTPTPQASQVPAAPPPPPTSIAATTAPAAAATSPAPTSPAAAGTRTAVTNTAPPAQTRAAQTKAAQTKAAQTRAARTKATQTKAGQAAAGSTVGGTR